MEETKILIHMQLEFELSHLESNTVFGLQPGISVWRIGKPKDLLVPEIDISDLAHQEIVSRQHAEIRIDNGSYYLIDVGSANGTSLNSEKLVVGNLYKLKTGDRITLGAEDESMVFVFQAKTPSSPIPLVSSSPTILQTQTLRGSIQTPQSTSAINRSSKITGLVLIAIAVLIIAINTQIGIFVRIPGLLLCAAGAILQFQHRINKNIGWVLIAAGILIILTGNVFASVNLLAIIIAAALLYAGYQLISTGKILNRSLFDLRNTVKGLFKGK